MPSSHASKTSHAPKTPESPPTLLAGPIEGLSIGEYLIRRLQEYGVRDVFGIPGD
jgi:indolepyruvate decarboxylase